MSEVKKSSRTNETQVGYFRDTADLLILYQTFNSRLLAEKVHSFSYDLNNQPFDPAIFSTRSPKPLYPTHVVEVDLYSVGAAKSLVGSFETLLKINNFTRKKPSIEIDVPFNTDAYTSSYVQKLLRKVGGGGIEHTVTNYHDDGKEFPVERLFSDAMVNAAIVTGRLVALFGKDFSSSYPVIVSQLPFHNLEKAKQMMGIAKKGQQANYDLIDPDHGINLELVRSLGSTSAIGCPAAIPASPEMKAYIEENFGVDVKKKSMLHIFADDYKTHFDQTIMPWFNNLSAEQRNGSDDLDYDGFVQTQVIRQISPETELLLSGARWEDIQLS